MQTQGVAATGHSYIVYNREIQSWLTGSFCDFHQVSRYVSYRDSSIAIRIVSWGYRIVTPLIKSRFNTGCCYSIYCKLIPKCMSFIYNTSINYFCNLIIYICTSTVPVNCHDIGPLIAYQISIIDIPGLIIFCMYWRVWKRETEGHISVSLKPDIHIRNFSRMHPLLLNMLPTIELRFP